MTTSDKAKLIELLDIYKAELMAKNITQKKDKWGCVTPTKALFTHARVLSEKLSVEIESELKSIYQS